MLSIRSNLDAPTCPAPTISIFMLFLLWVGRDILPATLRMQCARSSASAKRANRRGVSLPNWRHEPHHQTVEMPFRERLGGAVAHGIIGLFLGPIVLAVTWELIAAWVKHEEQPVVDVASEEAFAANRRSS